MTSEILELNEAETQWLTQLLADLTTRGIDPLDVHALDAYYNWAFAAAHAGTAPVGEDPDTVVNRVGAGLGEHLRSRLPMRWVVLRDQWGTDLALHYEPARLTTAPMSMVGKRWRDGRTGFLPELAESAFRSISSSIVTTRGTEPDGR